MRPNTVPAKPRLAIIDADGLLFAAALKGETTCDGEQMEMRPLSRTLKDLYQRIGEAMEAAGAEECYLALSDRRNFRYDILPSYKGQRAKGVRPLQLDRLRAAISEECEHRVFLIKTLEADDVCGIMADTLRRTGREVVVVSPDKDLAQVPGLLLQKGKVTEVTEESAFRWHVMQTLVGDTCDHYKGCPGWGPRKAGRLLDEAGANGWTIPETWAAVIQAFVDAGLTEEDALVQARVARILRASDWDAKEKCIKPWNFPK